MCDCYPGSVLLSVHWSDDLALAAIERSFAGHDIQDLDHAAGRNLDDLHLKYKYFQANVPPGTELFLIENFRRNYIDLSLDTGSGPQDLRQRLLDPTYAPIAQTEALATVGGLPAPSHGTSFSFTAEHQRNLWLINARTRLPGLSSYPVVGVIDSGWLAPPSMSPNIVSEADLTTDPVRNIAVDGYGHGSVVLSIINDIAPATRFRVYKVAEKTAREWTLLAAVSRAAADQCNMLNVSVGFGLKDRDCPTCGRDFGTTRSQVFHRHIADILDGHQDLVYVGAAGNQGLDRPIYPARFTPTICVASTNSNGALSTFSNWGDYDQDDRPHPCFALAPGGDRLRNNLGSDEYIAAYQALDWRGTSFSTAYVTGVLADHLSRSGPVSRAALISALNGAASTSKVAGYSSLDHGVGLVQGI